ncbi:MAG TPA: TMEM175 family protein [Candidatus Polarisedimenticolia bacterium]|nr:TMEM175 family protein [Candidatus Polarisedimenticolia bacterium]
MSKNRLEAFSDGVIAIIITIMVLDLKIPEHGKVDWSDLRPVLPAFFSYVLSFIYVGIYWNNHHHMLHATKEVSGGVLWANLHLLFWLSLFPFTTGWMDESWLEEHRLASAPTALYGVVLLMAAMAYIILQWAIIRKEGRHAMLAAAIGADWKGKLSPIFYLAAIPLAFVNPWISTGLFVLVALIWLVPDRRIERVVAKHEA